MLRKPATIWKTYEWEYIAKLLQKGYPLVDSLQILKKDTAAIEQKLQQGESLSVCLMPYASHHLQQHLTFFLSVTSLSNAITCAIHMVAFESEMKKKLKKETAYPLFIFFFAYLTLFFFIQFVIPQLLLSFPIETLDAFFIISIYLLKFLCFFISVFLLGGVILFTYYRFHPLPVKLLHNVMKQTLCREYLSYLFSSYLKELEMDGISTKAAISYLVHVQGKQMFTVFMKEIQTDIENGIELSSIIQSHPHLSDMFRMNFTIGVKTGTLVGCLQDYIIFQEERWIVTIHRFSTAIQIVSYGFVGFLVIMVYQILLVPLQLLENM